MHVRCEWRNNGQVWYSNLVFGSLGNVLSNVFFSFWSAKKC